MANENDLLKAYKQSQDTILNQIYKIFDSVGVDGTWNWIDMNKYNRASKMFDSIAKEIKKLGITENKTLEDMLITHYQNEYAKEIINLFKVLKSKDFEELQKKFDLKDYEENYYKLLQDAKGSISINFTQINDNAVKKTLEYPWSGDNFSTRLWNEKDKLITTLRQELTQSMILGESMSKASKRIKDKMGSGAYNATRLARTEIMRVTNESHIQAYKDNGIDQVQWLATLSERTCSICGGLDLKVFDIDEKPIMPSHPNCRCTWIAYFGNVSKRKDGETKEVINEQSYEEWKNLRIND